MKDRQSRNTQDFLAGHLLISTPSLTSGCFEKSVILICRHDEEHAMGLIMNKPLDDLTFDDILEQLDIKPTGLDNKRSVFFGGPVETKRGLVLHSMDYQEADTMEVIEGLGVTATLHTLKQLNTSNEAPEFAQLCMGHAGWGAGQLEHELAQNAWLSHRATPSLLRTLTGEDAWDKALAAMGISAHMLGCDWTEPRDPDAAPLN